MATKEEIVAKIMAEKSRGKRDDNAPRTVVGDNASYPFWNIPENSSALVRFLPDGDPDNTFFWVKREVIRLPFSGVVGGDYPTDKEVSIQVPCMDMFGETCPIISHTRQWWKPEAGSEKNTLARLYWKKKSFIFQGFVVQSSLEEQNVPENPIRRFMINPSIYEIIEKSLMDPEMEDLPIDFVGGRDFKIAKTRQGDYASYKTSSWSFKTRSLSENESIAIEQHGLFNLKEYLGRHPDSDEVAAIKQMFLDSLDGKPFDVESYGKYYRPFGSRNDDGETNVTRSPVSVQKQTPVSAPVVDETPSSHVSTPSVSGAKPNARDILERINNRTRSASN